MNNRSIDQANFNNLTCLWEHMGFSKQSQDSSFELKISDSWPYRCWASGEMNRAALAGTIQTMHELPGQYITPIWRQHDESVKNETCLFLDHGFKLVFEQAAMYLDMRQYAGEVSVELELVQVVSAWDVKMWTDVAARSFDYEIDQAVISRISMHPDIKLMMAFVNGEPAATVLIYLDSNVAGIHQMGVLPKHRGQGLARKLMQYVIHYCQQLGIRYITLQASFAGEPLYSKLGFNYQFKLYNFQQGK